MRVHVCAYTPVTLLCARHTAVAYDSSGRDSAPRCGPAAGSTGDTYDQIGITERGSSGRVTARHSHRVAGAAAAAATIAADIDRGFAH